MGTGVVGVSNNHVLAMDLFGNPISIGDWIFQPGLLDWDNCIDFPVNNKVGELADFEPIQFCSCSDLGSCPADSNFVDAAIFDTTSTALIGNATPSNGYGTPKSNTISPAGAWAAGGNVKKYGRTTGQTTGQISAINATVYVQYPNDLCARFDNQIMIGPANFSDGGDSGSLIVMHGGSDDRRPVGLLFAGSPTTTVANPIDAVLAAFGITVDGE
jgi:hypothetical protein